MTGPSYSGSLTGSDGSTLTVNAVLNPPVVQPPPQPTWTRAIIGGASHPIDATNPPASRNKYPCGRGPNELIFYRRPAVPRVLVNTYGWTVQIDYTGHVVGAGSGQLDVPVDGGALSGHGTAATWLQINAPIGAAVTLSDAPPAPPGPGPVTTRVAIEEWLMQWNGYGPYAHDLPATTNVVNLAFLQGAGIPVGWGNESQSQLVADLAGLKARPGGCAVLAGVGGQGGNVVTGNRAVFVADVLKYRSDLGGNLDGLNWDIEAGDLNGDDVLSISASLRGAVPGWQTVLSPNGGNVDTYLPVAIRLQQADLLTRYGQQFYDASVSLSAAQGRISDAIKAGIPVEKITVGMMIAPDSQHWTLQQCVDNMRAIKAKWPTIGGAYLWEAGRDQSAQWSAAMAALWS